MRARSTLDWSQAKILFVVFIETYYITYLNSDVCDRSQKSQLFSFDFDKPCTVA